MTQFGCDDDCLKCAGLACSACQELDVSLPIARNCPHTDPVLRHSGMRPIMPDPSRVSTRELEPIIGGKIIVEIAKDAHEPLALFFDMLARTLRASGGAEIIVRPLSPKPVNS